MPFGCSLWEWVLTGQQCSFAINIVWGISVLLQVLFLMNGRVLAGKMFAIVRTVRLGCSITDLIDDIRPEVPGQKPINNTGVR